MIVLSFTPCGDGWSVDRLWKIRQGRAVPDAGRASPVYGWSRYACWAVIALPYVANGLSKLVDGGLFWWLPINMRNHLYMDTLNPREFDWALSLYLHPCPRHFFLSAGPIWSVQRNVFRISLILPRRATDIPCRGNHVACRYLSLPENSIH